MTKVEKATAKLYSVIKYMAALDLFLGAVVVIKNMNLI